MEDDGWDVMYIVEAAVAKTPGVVAAFRGPQVTVVWRGSDTNTVDNRSWRGTWQGPPNVLTHRAGGRCAGNLE